MEFLDPLRCIDWNYRIGHSAKVWSPGTPANAPIGAVKTAFNKHGNQFNTFSQHVFSAENPDQKHQELLDEVRGKFQDFLKTRTADEPFLYVRNFRPDRWPMGVAPGFGLPEGPMPSAKMLDASMFAAFGDMDASPTKTWLLTEGLADPRYHRFIEMQFALRPEEELYDLRRDPDQIHNVASQPEFAQARKQLSDRLLTILKDSNDPRVTGDGSTFDSPPYSDPAK